MFLDHVFITYNDGVYNETTRTYDPINSSFLELTKDSLLFDTKRHTIFAQGIEFGYSYTFPFVNSGIGTVGNNLSSNVAYYITGIQQNIDGSISYTYSYSYFCTNLSVDSGAQNETEKITNESSYRFITNISQGVDGKISYTYGNFQTAFTNIGTTNGVLTNVNIDSTGLLSYDSIDLTVNNGKYTYTSFISTPQNTSIHNDFPSLTLYARATHIHTITGTTGLTLQQPMFGTPVITGISQNTNGKISYTYTALFADRLDFAYHKLSFEPTLINADTPVGAIKVLQNIGVTTDYPLPFPLNDGKMSKEHTITASYVFVPTLEHVNDLIEASDAMRYCGTFNANNGILELDSIDAPNFDTSRGAVYKCKEPGTIGTQVFAVGDWIISRKNDASASDLTGWDAFNANITINSLGIGSQNVEESSRLITNIYADDTGTVSYTYSRIATNNLKNTGANTGPIYEAITGIKIENNGLEIVLSYEYESIDTSTHYNVDPITKIGDGNAVSSVSVDSYGHLISVSYTDIQGTNVSFNTTTSKIYISGSKSTNNGVTTHSYIDGVSYIHNKQLYTHVSYFNQSYVGQLKVSGTTYLDGNIYAGNENTDKLNIVSKTIDFNSDTKIQFSHLKSLWGVVGQ